jgi:hypothetical protein
VRKDVRVINNVQLALNQQFQQGCACAQQGMLAEQVGNWPFSAQCYDQAIAIIGNAMAIAGQYGMPILDNVFASYAACHFQAARVKAAAGWANFAPAHLAAAAQAFNQAMAMRPDLAQYRTAAAMVQAAQGGLSGTNNLTPVGPAAQMQPAQASSGNASQKQWVELATKALTTVNMVGGLFQQAGQQGGGDWSQWNQGDWSQWNQGGSWSY